MITILFNTLLESAPYIVLGFFIAGIMRFYVPPGILQQHLGAGSTSSLFKSVGKTSCSSPSSRLFVSCNLSIFLAVRYINAPCDAHCTATEARSSSSKTAGLPQAFRVTTTAVHVVTGSRLSSIV